MTRDHDSGLGAALRRQLRDAYDWASFGGDPDALGHAEAELGVLQAELDLARGRLLHVRTMADRIDRPAELAAFEQAAAGLAGHDGEAEAVFWVGTYHQVVHGDDVTAATSLRRAEQLAEGDALVQSYVQRHLGFVALNDGRVDEARTRLEDSLRLRRQIGFSAGVAAAHVALAELEREHGDPRSVEDHLASARAVARECGATAVLRWADTVDGPSI